MAGKAIHERHELSQMIANRPRPRQRFFIAQVSLGMSYREAARRAGYHEDHGNRLMRKPAIRARVEELRDASEGERFLAGIHARLFLLDNRIGSGGLSEIRRQLKLADAEAKLLRLMEGRRQALGAEVNWRNINRADLEAMIERDLEALFPHERTRLRRIAAGEFAAIGDESKR